MSRARERERERFCQFTYRVRRFFRISGSVTGFECSNRRGRGGERERERKKERPYGRERGENVSMQAVERNTNAEKRDERGGRTTDVYHKSHCPPLTEFVDEPLSLFPLFPHPFPTPYPESCTRATRCKTLPVNFIALGTSSYILPRARRLTRGQGTATAPPAFAYTRPGA